MTWSSLNTLKSGRIHQTGNQRKILLPITGHSQMSASWPKAALRRISGSSVVAHEKSSRLVGRIVAFWCGIAFLRGIENFGPITVCNHVHIRMLESLKPVAA